MADWPIIAVRLAQYLDISVLFGLSSFGLYALKANDRTQALPLRPWLVASSILGLLLSCIGLFLLASRMAGQPWWPIDWSAVGSLLTGSSFATAWMVRMAALCVAGIGASMLQRGTWLILTALASGVGLATLAWAGHGIADQGAVGWAHLTADILHLLAAGGWIGALVALVLLTGRPRAELSHLRLTLHALQGFGLVGSILVGGIVVTGLVNAWLLVGVGNLGRFGSSLYLQLLGAKLVLFGLMLVLAASNRFRWTPGLERALAVQDLGRAHRVLRRSLAVETTSAVAILALVAWLGTLEPPVSGM
jgi:putative copper resistance protein D